MTQATELHRMTQATELHRMTQKNTEFLYKEITEEIIGAAFEVYKVLGYGFLEKVYHKALIVELR